MDNVKQERRQRIMSRKILENGWKHRWFDREDVDVHLDMA